MKDEPAVGRNAPTHRDRFRILLIFHPDPRLVKGSIFFVEGSYYVVDVERVGCGDHGRKIKTRGRVLQFVGVGHFSLELDVCPEVVLYCTKTTN